MPGTLPSGTHSLPPLGGRLFAAYRVLWWVLLASAILASGVSLFDPSTHPLILGLRLAKSAVLVAVAAILFRRRSRDAVAAMLGLSFLLWTISSSVDFIGSSGPSWPILIDRLRFLPFAFALLLFPDGQWRANLTGPIAAAILVVFLIGTAEATHFLSTTLYLPLAVGCVLLALASLLARYRSQPTTTQQQLKWVALGLVAGIGFILAARAGAAFSPPESLSMFGKILLEAIFQLGIVIIALGFLTSLLRYRLYDAEAAISRSAVYAVLTLALIGTFSASEPLFELLGQHFFGMTIGDVAGVVAAGLAAMMLTPLHDRLSTWAEQRFQHDLAQLKSELPDLLAVMSTGASTKQLAAGVLPRIEEAVHATRLALYVGGKCVATQGLSRAAAQRLLRGWIPPEAVDRFDRDEEHPFPLRIALRCPLGNISGWMLLGPRPDGSFYGKDDLEALCEIAPPLQRTLFAVAERETVQARERRVRNAMAMSISRLEMRISAIELGIAAAPPVP